MALSLLPATLSAAPYEDVARLYGLPEAPAPSQLRICHDYGCVAQSTIRFSTRQWGRIRALFHPKAPDSQTERQRLATAIAWLEQWSGEQARTTHDRGGNPLAASFNDARQLDCIDETVNTTTYLHLLQRDGLLAWHRLGTPAHRGIPPFSWPHNTAVIVDGSGKAWAVDSWFEDNGKPPHIVQLSAWKAGWRPQ